MEKRIYIRVPEQLLKDFDRACEANYTNKSEVLRRAMLEYVRETKKEDVNMKKLLQKARKKVEEEMKRVGFIDDSDNSDRFLDNLSQKLAKEEVLKGNENIDFYYEKEDEIEQLQEKLLEEIRDKIMGKYNRFYECKNGQYIACFYETIDGLKAWKEV